ncbi:MAG: hypothetical protein AAF911_07640 [Planctomycetota bacterium]
MNRSRGSVVGLKFACLLMGAVWLGGCATPTPDIDGIIRPVDPGRPGPEAGLMLPENNPVRWVSRKLAVPLEQSTEDAWAEANEDVLSPLSRAVWNANGLRVGVLPAARGRAFSDALGSTLDPRDTQILSYSFPEDVRESPPLRAEFFADLTVPPRPVTIETFTRGRIRMLMASRPLGNGNTRVTLTPQHYQRRTTLLPRTPQERELDGRVFDELTIEVTVGRNDLLLMGFYQPPPETNNTEPETSDEVSPSSETDGPAALPNRLAIDENGEPISDGDTIAETESDVEMDASDETAEAAIPPLNLGRGLFTTGIRDDDLQFVFLLAPSP